MSPVSYAEVLTDLAGATGRLVAAGPPRAGDRLTGVAADRSLACRDLLISELRSFTGLLVGARSNPDQPLGLPDVIANPVHVMTDGLRQLPAVAADAGAPSEVLGGGRDGWSAAAGAAVGLEMFHGTAMRLLPQARWAALADLAELAVAVPYLDADLAARLPAGRAEAAAALADPVPHGLVRLAADELRLQLRGLEVPGYLHRLDRAPTVPVVLRSPADLPDGMRRLSAVLRHVGPEIATADFHAVTRVLAVGAAEAQRRAGTDGLPAAVAAALGSALPGLLRVPDARLATVARPDRRIGAMATEVYGQLQRLAPDPSPAGTTAAAAWVRAAAPAGDALHQALRAAAATGRLLTRPDGYQTHSQEHLAWLPIPAAVGPHHPVITGLADTARQLDRARAALPRTSSAATDPAGQATRSAASAAGRAVRELRTALNNRSPQQLPQPRPLPARPAQQRALKQPPTPRR